MGNSAKSDAQFKMEIEKAKLAMEALNMTGADRIALLANLIRSNNGTEETPSTEPAPIVPTAPVAAPVKSGPTGRTVALAPKKAKPAPAPVTLVKMQCSVEKDGAICPNMVEIDEKYVTIKVGDKIVPRKIFCDEHRHSCEGCKKLIPPGYKFCKKCGPQQKIVDSHKPAAPKAVVAPVVPKTPLPCRGWYKAENGRQITCGTLTTNYGQICDSCRVLCKGGCGKLIPHWHDLCPGCNAKKEKAAPAVTDSKIGTKVELPDGPNEGVMKRACWADDLLPDGSRNHQKQCGKLTTHPTGLCDEHVHPCKGVCGQQIFVQFEYCQRADCRAKERGDDKPQAQFKGPSEATIVAQNEARQAAEKDAKRRTELETAITDKLSKFAPDADTVVKMTARVMKKYGDLLTADDALKTAALNKQITVEGENDSKTVDPTAWIYAQASGYTDEEHFLAAVETERQAKVAKVMELADKKGKLTYGAARPLPPKKKEEKKGGKKQDRKRIQMDQHQK